jgi:hypothetical protein
MTTKPKRKCAELEKLEREAALAGTLAAQTGRFAEFGASERQEEAQRRIDALARHLLAGHDGKPCPSGNPPIAKPRETMC